uniref:Hexosyltransferase n=1 Tax=Kalanchoe fedtschenkoi TaxID=63787 RepID=A0A7N0SY65_KALFE
MERPNCRSCVNSVWFCSADGSPYVEDLVNLKLRSDALRLNIIKQESDQKLKEPKQVLYDERDLGNVPNHDSTKEGSQSEEAVRTKERLRLLERSEDNETSRGKEVRSQLNRSPLLQQGSNQTTARPNQFLQSSIKTPKDEKVKEIRDQLIRARLYLKFAPPKINAQLIRELKARIKDLERSLGGATKDSDLRRSVMQKMKSMEATLIKASHVFSDCPAMVTKLRAMTHSAEEQVQAHMKQATHLVNLAGRTTPKAFHCLSMRLISEYFALQPERREFQNKKELTNPDSYHYAIFSDNVLACAVVVNSTVSAALEPEKIVFHIVTDSLNFHAISMWFLSNPPGKASMQIQSIDQFDHVFSNYGLTLQQTSSADSRYTSPLNHLRFYLPDIFPMLNKIVLLDHDVVVQRDLRRLWDIKMKGKVIGAVQTCQENEPSYRRMDSYINFSDQLIAKKFDPKACTWAFGMNIIDLKAWIRQNSTAMYHKYLSMGQKRPVFKAGTLPLGWVTFYNQTVPLDKKWHILGLGYESSTTITGLEHAAVLHYDGVMKPWLEIGIAKYKNYWNRHLNYDHPFLQQCNIHR